MRCVVITGGTRGIGAATVRRFAAAGDRVYFLYEKSTELAQAMEQETGAVGIRCDVTQEEAVARAFHYEDNPETVSTASAFFSAIPLGRKNGKPGPSSQSMNSCISLPRRR